MRYALIFIKGIIRKCILKLLYSLIIISYFSSSVFAQEQTLEIVTEHWPPYIVQASDVKGEISGIVTKKIKAIFDNTTLKYQITAYPWARSYYLAKTKPNTLIYSIYKTEQRSKHFKWFCPIHDKTPVNIYKLKNNQTDITNLISLENAIVGVLRNDNSHNYMLDKGFIEGKNLLVSSNEENNIHHLLSGKIDAVIQSREALLYRIKDSGLTIADFDIGFQLHKEGNTEHCMALSNNSDPELIKTVENAFNTWLKNK